MEYTDKMTQTNSNCALSYSEKINKFQTIKNIRKNNLSLQIYSRKKYKDKLKDNRGKDELQNENIFNKLYIKSIGKELTSPSKSLHTRDFSNFEIKEIMKRYQLNMEKLSNGFSNDYIDLLTDFLYSKKKGYSKERLKLSDYRIYLTKHNKKSQINFIEGFNNYTNKSYNNKYNNKLVISENVSPNRNKFQKNKKFLNYLYNIHKYKLRNRNSPNDNNFYNSRIMTNYRSRKINKFNENNELNDNIKTNYVNLYKNIKIVKFRNLNKLYSNNDDILNIKNHLNSNNNTISNLANTINNNSKDLNIIINKDKNNNKDNNNDVSKIVINKYSSYSNKSINKTNSSENIYYCKTQNNNIEKGENRNNFDEKFEEEKNVFLGINEIKNSIYKEDLERKEEFLESGDKDKYEAYLKNRFNFYEDLEDRQEKNLNEIKKKHLNIFKHKNIEMKNNIQKFKLNYIKKISNDKKEEKTNSHKVYNIHDLFKEKLNKSLLKKIKLLQNNRDIFKNLKTIIK